MNKVTEAYHKAKAIVSTLLKADCNDELRAELNKLTKAQLVELIIAERAPKQTPIVTIAYALMTDMDCTWLSYDQLAAVIRELVPGAKTKESNLRWYYSKQNEFGYECLVRRSSKEVTAELMRGIE